MTGRRAILGIVVACAAQLLIGADGLAVAIALPALRDASAPRRSTPSGC